MEPPPAPLRTPNIPAGTLGRYGARVLDPATAIQTPDQRIAPTIYLPDRLLVRGMPTRRADATINRLQGWNDQNQTGLTVTVSQRDQEFVDQLDNPADAEFFDQTWTTQVRLSNNTGRPQAPPDAWQILQQLLKEDSGLAEDVALDHVMSAGPTWGGVSGVWGGVSGVWGGVSGVWGGVGGLAAAYGGPGLGGRTPVVWSAPDPRLTAPEPVREPVIAVLDTGLGTHPWFDPASGGCTETIMFRGAPIGVPTTEATDPRATGVVSDPLNGLVDPLAGHGTFVAGIIRQRCPSAYLMMVPVLAADGTVTEHDVLTALNQLLWLHHHAEFEGGRCLDVVNLSMGYYHETPEHRTAGAPLKAVLQEYAKAGIAVVAAAGNGATSERFLPAGLADKLSGAMGLTSVGALNPDGHTVALFSNNGSWVTTHAPGAAVVSTVPTTLAGGLGRAVAVQRDDPLPRATIDADDYRSGFAIWSGTSFAAPWITGEIAAGIAATGDLAASVRTVLDDQKQTLATALRSRS
ncbi:S8/S53 family peptidase [Microlunatus parietis]|uniref:Peptidase S8/S53 domain-containing protein n=1 Tax=Microlunatus parietis TaxID=682979 RepID=A0A7Y9LC78_9ACTN|nr:S8/S53 family peptidase [Microlunatus parietis]NYE70591.1 hypothetical protein [Microlunatus parietis]